MTFIEKLQTIDRVHSLINRKATGTADDLASKLNVSRRCVYDIINLMKMMGAPIEFCTSRRTYYYTHPCELMIGFQDKSRVIGGKSNYFQNLFSSADFLHRQDFPLWQITLSEGDAENPALRG